METKQLGAHIRVEVIDELRKLSKRERISMSVLTERALMRMISEAKAAGAADA
jgi:hypothetical protein